MDLTKYKHIVGYGAGQFYDHVKSQLPTNLHVECLCDRGWQELGGSYLGMEVISPEQLSSMEDVFVIVFSGNTRNYNSICKVLDGMGFPHCHANDLLDIKKEIRGSDLKKIKTGIYEDANGNKIYFAPDIEECILIRFTGKYNVVRIGRQVSAGQLSILCGNRGVCEIGDRTMIEGCCIQITDGEVKIGKDCLFSTMVNIRNHDSHHIFDSKTGKRINYSGNIRIGNHVWVGFGATLLGNASIGDNSVVGARAVTSSSFPAEVIVAGNPASVIRKQVCWSKDNTEFYQRESLEECMAQEAKEYLS